MKFFSKLVLGLVLAFGTPSLHAAAAENNYIAVTGDGKAQQWPDYAVVKASVWAKEKTPKEAVSKSTENLLALAKALQKMGIPDERIEFLPPDIAPDEKHVRLENGDYNNVVVGFISAQGIKVTVNKVGRIGKVITVLTNNGARIDRGVTFKLKDPGKLKARARALAIADARKKAGDYAAGAKRRLGKLLIVEESMIRSYRLSPLLREVITGTTPHLRGFSGSLSAPPSVPVTPQPVSATVSLYVKYALQ